MFVFRGLDQEVYQLPAAAEMLCRVTDNSVLVKMNRPGCLSSLATVAQRQVPKLLDNTGAFPEAPSSKLYP